MPSQFNLKSSFQIQQVFQTGGIKGNGIIACPPADFDDENEQPNTNTQDFITQMTFNDFNPDTSQMSSEGINVNGTSNDDIIYGSDFNDVIYSQGGSDIIYGYGDCDFQ